MVWYPHVTRSARGANPTAWLLLAYTIRVTRAYRIASSTLWVTRTWVSSAVSNDVSPASDAKWTTAS